MSSYGKEIMMPTRQSSQLGTHGTISELPEERLLGTKAAVYTICREPNSRKHGDISRSADTLIDRHVKNIIATLRIDKRMETAYQSWIGFVGT
ncbi:hypothetical protein YC2023_072755 [Brassica napus]